MSHKTCVLIFFIPSIKSSFILEKNPLTISFMSLTCSQPLRVDVTARKASSIGFSTYNSNLSIKY